MYKSDVYVYLGTYIRNPIHPHKSSLNETPSRHFSRVFYPFLSPPYLIAAIFPQSAVVLLHLPLSVPGIRGFTSTHSPCFSWGRFRISPRNTIKMHTCSMSVFALFWYHNLGYNTSIHNRQHPWMWCYSIAPLFQMIQYWDLSRRTMANQWNKRGLPRSAFSRTLL